LVGLAASLVDVEVLDGDLAAVVALGGIGVFAEEAGDVA